LLASAHHLHMHCVLKELNTCEAARKWVYSNFFAPYDEVIEKLNQLKKNKKINIRSVCYARSIQIYWRLFFVYLVSSASFLSSKFSGL
jgi:uncharacterized membrane protein